MELQHGRKNRGTEADYKELARLGALLGVPVPEVFVGWEVARKGAVLVRGRSRSHTWNRNYWNEVLMVLAGTPLVATNFGAGYISMKQIGGTVTAISPNDYKFNLPAVAGATNMHITVGTGTGAESFEGYAMGTLIAHGNGAGQLNYLASETPEQTYVAETKIWTIRLKRYMDNNSGGSIGVEEVALNCKLTNPTYYYMISRDKLASTLNVPAASRLTMYYDLALTFPA